MNNAEMIDNFAKERFLALVLPDPDSDCQLWTGSTTGGGYGQFRVGDKMVRAHRFAYEAKRGPIPPGLQIDHLCRVRDCVNPAHLECVTPAENVRRGEAGEPQLARTHCPQGHPYDEANTYQRPDRQPSRDCRACRAAAGRKYRERKRRAP